MGLETWKIKKKKKKGVVWTWFLLSNAFPNTVLINSFGYGTGSVSEISARLPTHAIITEAIDEIQRVTGEHGNVGDPSLHLQLDFSTVRGGAAVVEAAEASVTVGEGGAGPRLSVAHLPLEGSGAEVLQLVERVDQLSHRVGYLLYVVTPHNSLSLHETWQRVIQHLKVNGEGARVDQANLDLGLG